MDAKIEGFRRGYEADPSNIGAKHAYLKALLEAGRRQEFQELVGMSVLCTTQWSNLKETDTRGQRHCHGCDRTVYYSSTAQELASHRSQGHCVAIKLAAVSAWVESAVIQDPSLLALESPCLMNSEAAWLDISRQSISREALDIISGGFARRNRVIPLSIDSKVCLALDQAKPTLIATLKERLGQEIDWVLTDASLIDWALDYYYEETSFNPLLGFV